MRLTATWQREIDWGGQFTLAADDGSTATIDYYYGSKQRRILVRNASSRAFKDFLEDNVDALRTRLAPLCASPFAEPAAFEIAAVEAQTLFADGRWRLFSDGGSKPNPGPGAYGVVLVHPDGEREEWAGYDPDTTNNRMELAGVIDGLGHVPPGAAAVVTTDSQYVKNGITSWIKGWKKNGWLTATREPVKNADLWRALDALAAERTLAWQWVKGHAGHPENERCDALATECRRAGRALRG